MACYTRNGSLGVVQFFLNGKVKKVYGLSKREGERLGYKLEALKAAKKAGSMPPELLAWAKELETENPALYDKIHRWGLLPERVAPKTLGGLLEAYNGRVDVKEETKWTWKLISENLLEFFTAEKPLEEITPEDAARFGRWIHTAKLNTRTSTPRPLAVATANKRISHAKNIFSYAVKLGWLVASPFRFLKSGDSTNPGNLEYVEMERFGQVLEVAPLYWRLLLMFGRFCGVRGSSELYRMEWGDIHISSAEESGWVAIRASKNERHGRKYRVVPLPAIMEPALVEWMEQATEGEPRVFPNMKKRQNFSVMVEKLARRAGVAPWRNPWYNLRKSFCTDLIQAVKDIPTYEQITDHSYSISVKHYQIMTGGRLARGMEAARDVWNQLEAGGLENGLVMGQKTGLTCNPSVFKRSNDEAGNPCFLGTYEKEKGRLQMLANGQGRGDRT